MSKPISPSLRNSVPSWVIDVLAKGQADLALPWLIRWLHLIREGHTKPASLAKGALYGPCLAPSSSHLHKHCSENANRAL